MQPKDRRPSRRSARSAAATYLHKQLGWLRGYPSGVRDDGTVDWITVPRLSRRLAPESIVVTREHVRRASYGRRRAATRFPRALPVVVGDVARWAARVEERLTILKAVLHDGAPLPDSARLRELFAGERATRDRLNGLVRVPAFARLVDAWLWIHADDTDALARALDVLAARAGWFQSLLNHLPDEIALRFATLVSEMAAEGVDVCEALPVLGDERIWEIPTSGAKQAVARLIAASRHAHEEPVGDVLAPRIDTATRLCEWVLLLPSWPVPARAHALDLMGRLFDPAVLDEWETWWRRARQLARTLRRESRKRLKPFWKDFRAQVQATLQPPPPSCRFDPWMASVAAVAMRASAEIVATLSSVLAELPAIAQGEMPRLTQLAAADPASFRWSETHPNRLLETLRAQRAVLECLPADALRHRVWCGGSLLHGLCDLLTWRPVAASVLERLNALLAYAGEQAAGWPADDVNPFPMWTWTILHGALETSATIPDVWRLHRALSHDEYHYLNDKAVAYLLRMTAVDAERFAPLVAPWAAQDDEDRPIADFLLGTDAGPEWFALIESAVSVGEAKCVFDVVRRVRLVLDLAPDGPTIDPHAGRADAGSLALAEFPVALHDVIRRLARFDDDHEETIARLRREVLPDHERWRRELAALAVRRDEVPPDVRAHMDARRRKLETWMTDPPWPSAGRVARIRRRLERRSVRARLEAIDTQVDAALRAALRHRMGSDGSTEWSDRARQGVVGYLVSLSPRFRALGFELLRRATTSGSPVDFRDEPANERFMETMRRNAVNLGPWLDDHWAPPEDAGALRLERDPFGVLEMGEPFGTCLAPGADNFFSAVANAVDVNKQLVVERRRGKMRGRCLIALDREGRIVTFHCYTHEEAEAFQARVGRFVHALAEAMQTSVVSCGVIEPLVAPDWYDDGPVDLLDPAGRFDWEALLGSRVLEPSKILASVRDVTGSEGPSPSLLRDFLRWHGVRNQPGLLRPVLEHLTHARLDPRTRIELAELALGTGMPGLTNRFIEPLLSASGRRTIQRLWLDQTVIDLAWQAGRPALALALLRETRPRGVRTWLDEDAERMWSAACSFEALHRPARALTLFEALADQGVQGAHHAIERLLGGEAEDPGT